MMETTGEKLNKVATTKANIKAALMGKGVDMSGAVFADYASKIRNIESTVPVSGIAAVFRTKLNEAMASNPQLPYGMIVAIEINDFIPVDSFTYNAGIMCSDNSLETGDIINNRSAYKLIFSDGAEYTANFVHTYDKSKYLEMNGNRHIYMILLGDGNYPRAGIIKINDAAANLYLYQYARYIIFSDNTCSFTAGDLSKSLLLDYIEFGRNSICFGIGQNIAFSGLRYANPRYIYNLNLDRVNSTAESVFPNNVSSVTVRNIQKNLNLTGRGLLSKNSVMSILDALCDNSGSDTALSLTLPSLIFVSLTDDMKAIATQKNWTIIKGSDF